MGASVEAAYIAVERAYGEGRFSAALEQAQALLPELERGRGDLLDLRLQLLIGHIHWYGLQQPAEAAAAYAQVLESSNDEAYQALARQGLELCSSASQAEEAQPCEPPTPAATTPAGLPAAPWLSQLADPESALQQIQAAWSTAIPSERRSTAARVAAGIPAGDSAGDTSIEAVRVSVAEVEEASAPAPTSALLESESETETENEPETEAIDPAWGDAELPEPKPEAALSSAPGEPPFSPEEWADQARGWLLVDLNSQPGLMR